MAEPRARPPAGGIKQGGKPGFDNRTRIPKGAKPKDQGSRMGRALLIGGGVVLAIVGGRYLYIVTREKPAPPPATQPTADEISKKISQVTASKQEPGAANPAAGAAAPRPKVDIPPQERPRVEKPSKILTLNQLRNPSDPEESYPDVLAQVEKLIPIAQECHRSGLPASPEYDAKLKLTLSISGDGQIQDAWLEAPSTNRNPAVEACVRAAAYRLRTRELRGGKAIEVVVHLDFRPGRK
ncbi:MAG: hypothetical protein GMKNLPBB_03250 [Myxococcota bacterium]|nr:hypothetical protein [Myxococcota bacterium]